MGLAQLIAFPPHLLAATLQRGRDRYPVTVKDIGPAHLVVTAAPLASGERARLTIACPLTSIACELDVTAENHAPYLTLFAI